MYPILFKIGTFTFYTHGVLAVLGIFVGTMCLYYLAKREKLHLTYLFDNMVYTVLFGIIGARLAYFLLYRNQFNSFKEIMFLWEGGMVSYGGFVLGALGLILLLRSQKEPMLKWFDLASIAFPLGLFFGRLGNIFAGEYSGIHTFSKFNLDGVVPVTLYEAFICLAIFIGLFFIYKKNKLEQGVILSFSLAAYGLGRFVLDFWRDEKDLFFTISLGQTVSILIFLAGVYLFVSSLKRKRLK